MTQSYGEPIDNHGMFYLTTPSLVPVALRSLLQNRLAYEAKERLWQDRAAVIQCSRGM